MSGCVDSPFDRLRASGFVAPSIKTEGKVYQLSR